MFEPKIKAGNKSYHNASAYQLIEVALQSLVLIRVGTEECIWKIGPPGTWVVENTAEDCGERRQQRGGCDAKTRS